MNPLERTIALKALSDWLAERKREGDAEVKTLFEPGDRKAVRRDGQKLGEITVSDPKPAWKVTDRAAFTRWVQENHPAAVVTEVRVVPAWEATLLRDPVDADGVIPDGVEMKTATPSWIVKPAPDALRVLADDLPGLLEVTSGE